MEEVKKWVLPFSFCDLLSTWTSCCGMISSTYLVNFPSCQKTKHFSSSKHSFQYFSQKEVARKPVRFMHECTTHGSSISSIYLRHSLPIDLLIQLFSCFRQHSSIPRMHVVQQAFREWGKISNAKLVVFFSLRFMSWKVTQCHQSKCTGKLYVVRFASFCGNHD